MGILLDDSHHNRQVPHSLHDVDQVDPVFRDEFGVCEIATKVKPRRFADGDEAVVLLVSPLFILNAIIDHGRTGIWRSLKLACENWRKGIRAEGGRLSFIFSKFLDKLIQDLPGIGLSPERLVGFVGVTVPILR